MTPTRIAPVNFLCVKWFCCCNSRASLYRKMLKKSQSTLNKEMDLQKMIQRQRT